MCFYHDYDWHADISDLSRETAAKPISCEECRATIMPGEIFHHLYQQEHEECYRCSEGDCDCVKDADGDCWQGCQCAEPDFGETAEFIWCDCCQRFLDIIKKLEIAEGCAPMYSRPPLGALREEFWEQGRDQVKKYFKEAAHADVSLKPYLARLWKAVFGKE